MPKPFARWMLFLLSIALAAGCAKTSQETKPAVDASAVTAQIDSLNQVWLAAVTAKDSVALANLYADDARVLPAGMKRVDGKDSIRSMWGSFLQTPGLEFHFTSTEKIVSEAGDLVVDIGTYEMKWTGAKGKPAGDVGKFVTVLKKVNGEWKIIVDTFNSDTPMPM